MAPKRGRVFDEKQPEEQTPCKKQLKFDDEQEEKEDEDESKTDSKGNYEINPTVKEPNKAAKTDKEKAVDVSKPQNQAVAVEEDVDGLEKKPLITRLWSFNDELVVLQAILDFKEEDNYKNHDDFFDFVKGKLNYTKFTKVQVKDKIRKLKKKYKTNLNKSSFSGKDPHFSNPHDLKCFQLSKRIWSDLDANNDDDDNNDNNNNAKEAGGALVEDDITRVEDERKGMVEKDLSKEEEKDFPRLYPHIMKAFEGESLPNVTLLDDLKTYLSKIDSVLLEEWDRKWKKVRLAETDAYLRRLALIQEQTNWFYNQMKSSKY